MLLQLINIGLRATILLSKFLLIFMIARTLPPRELGVYGVFVVTIGYSMYFVGLDFYTYSTRELLKNEREHWGGYLKSQVVLIFCLYLVFIPLSALLFHNKIIPMPGAYFLWFIVLLVLEHLNQEAMRLLITASKPVFATVVLFFRSGLWGLIIVFILLYELYPANLDLILMGWLFGNIVALLVASIGVVSTNIGGWSKEINMKWILLGIKISIPLLIATLAIRAIFTIDRYWVSYLTDLNTLGVYVFFISIAGAMTSFIDAGVFSFIYPKMISAVNKKDKIIFEQSLQKMTIQVLGSSAIFIASSYLLIDYILTWIDKPVYTEYIGFLWWLLLANFFYCLSMIPHYVLYAQGIDKPIIQSHVIGFVLFVVSVLLINKFSTVYAVPIGMCLTFIFVFLLKTYLCIKYGRFNEVAIG